MVETPLLDFEKETKAIHKLLESRQSNTLTNLLSFTNASSRLSQQGLLPFGYPESLVLITHSSPKSFMMCSIIISIELPP
jgi:hypothetical protein